MYALGFVICHGSLFRNKRSTHQKNTQYCRTKCHTQCYYFCLICAFHVLFHSLSLLKFYRFKEKKERRIKSDEIVDPYILDLSNKLNNIELRENDFNFVLKHFFPN